MRPHLPVPWWHFSGPRGSTQRQQRTEDSPRFRQPVLLRTSMTLVGTADPLSFHPRGPNHGPQQTVRHTLAFRVALCPKPAPPAEAQEPHWQAAPGSAAAGWRKAGLGPPGRAPALCLLSPLALGVTRPHAASPTPVTGLHGHAHICCETSQPQKPRAKAS